VNIYSAQCRPVAKSENDTDIAVATLGYCLVKTENEWLKTELIKKLNWCSYQLKTPTRSITSRSHTERWFLYVIPTNSVRLLGVL